MGGLVWMRYCISGWISITPLRVPYLYVSLYVLWLRTVTEKNQQNALAGTFVTSQSKQLFCAYMSKMFGFIWLHMLVYMKRMIGGKMSKWYRKLVFFSFRCSFRDHYCYFLSGLPVLYLILIALMFLYM